MVIVTGGNSGTGYATSKALYEKGATVYLACRSRKKAMTAIDDIQRGAMYDITGITYPAGPRDESELKRRGRLEFLELDLADLESVKKSAEEFQRRETRLDVLYANAGVMATPEGLHTKQGYTLQFGTNALGHQYLISLLLPTLLRGPSLDTPTLGRIIVSSSAGHAAAPSGGFKPLSVARDPPPIGDWRDKTYGAADGSVEYGVGQERRRGEHELMRWIEYGQSKWGGIALARWLHWTYGPSEGREKQALAQDAGKDQVISIALHPGMISSNLAQHISLTPYVLKWAPWLIVSPSLLRRTRLILSQRLITRPPADGALTQLWAGTCPDAEARTLSGQYLVPFHKVGRARMDLDDREKVKALWDWCSEQTAGI